MRLPFFRFRKGRKDSPSNADESLRRGFQSDHVYEVIECTDRRGKRLSGSLGWTFGDQTSVSYRILDLELDFSGTGFDVWEAFLEMRKPLEKAGFRIQCTGALPHVRPSGMARGMGDGSTAYILRLGVSPDPEKDLVYIFEPLSEDEAVTLGKQEQFFKRWQQSIDNLE